MPHLIVEFSAEQASRAQVERMLDAAHQAVVDSGLFEPDHIRVRALPLAFYRCGGEASHFIHAQLRLHRGRSPEQKRCCAAAVRDALQAQAWLASSITVEVVEMDSDSYARAL